MLPEGIASLLRSLERRPSPYYNERVAALAGESSDRRAAAWRALQPTTRQSLIADQRAHPPYGSRARIDAGPAVRAGAVGHEADLLVQLWTAADLERERAAGVRCLERCGVRAGMRVGNTLAGALHTPGSLLVGDVVDDLGGLDIPLGEVHDSRSAGAAWTLAVRVGVEALIIPGDAAATTLRELPESLAARLSALIIVDRADARRAGNYVGGIPPLPGFRGRWGRWLAVPEATCFAAVQCDHGPYHGVGDAVLELAGDEWREGAEGPLLITPLERDFVMLRFDPRIRAAVERCACGLGFRAVEPDVGET